MGVSRGAAAPSPAGRPAQDSLGWAAVDQARREAGAPTGAAMLEGRSRAEGDHGRPGAGPLRRALGLLRSLAWLARR